MAVQQSKRIRRSEIRDRKDKERKRGVSNRTRGDSSFFIPKIAAEKFCGLVRKGVLWYDKKQKKFAGSSTDGKRRTEKEGDDKMRKGKGRENYYSAQGVKIGKTYEREI